MLNFRAYREKCAIASMSDVMIKYNIHRHKSRLTVKQTERYYADLDASLRVYYGNICETALVDIGCQFYESALSYAVYRKTLDGELTIKKLRKIQKEYPLSQDYNCRDLFLPQRHEPMPIHEVRYNAMWQNVVSNVLNDPDITPLLVQSYAHR